MLTRASPSEKIEGPVELRLDGHPAPGVDITELAGRHDGKQLDLLISPDGQRPGHYDQAR